MNLPRLKKPSTKLLVDLRERRLPSVVGRKALNLRRLVDLNLPVPVTYVCTWMAHQRYLANDLALLDQLQRELETRLDPSKHYAVRSSANIEDGSKDSYAGQFNSNLDVSAGNSIINAMWHIWATTQSSRIEAYQSRKESVGSEAQENLKMAVIIQEMVNPVVSGVSFSRNPLTGENEVVVEAMPGRGDRFLQDGATPQRWVNGHGKWIKQPEETEIPLDLIAHVVEKTGYIAKKIKAPVDLEWVYNGEQIYWVQLRQITSSRQLKIYTNSISKDMLPGMIKPLVWSVNIPMVGNTWVRVLTELIGPNDLQADELIKAFYYRTYFEMGAFGRIFSMLGLPEETLELMMGLRQKQAHEKMFRLNRSQVRLLPRALRFIIDKARFSRKVDAFLPRMQAAYNELYLTDTSALPDKELLARIQRLIHITSETAYYNIIAPLLMQVYNGVLRQEVAGAGVDYTNLDLLEGIDKIHDYDPGGYLLKLNLIYNQLAPEDQAMVAEGRVEDIEAAAGLQKFRSEFHDFIARFGHLSDSGNDFSFIPWREQPGHLLKMIANFHQPPRTGNSLISFHQVQLPAWKRGMVKNIFSMMQRFRLYREQISSLYTFGYGLLRVYFLALGEHMVHQGILGNPNDIFYLTFPEVCSLVEKPVQDQDYAALSSQRRLDMEQCRSFTPPEIIYGDQVPPVETYRGEKLQGTPTSRGRYTGRAVVVNSLADFTRMNSGAVLVIPYSDVGWTPLFLKAGGVVSESGGMLSHSSIIAREFGIPAVVSISNATRLLDGEMVTVDGYQGEVIIHTQA